MFDKDLWETRGKGDVKNPLCMRDCPIEGKIESSIPVAARNANGNIAEQVRPFGPARGTDTSVAPRTEPVGVPTKVAAATAPASVGMHAAAEGPSLVKANSCTSCHGMTNKIVGPAFEDVAKRYAGRADAVEYLAGKIRKGGQGVWGSIPMPEQAQLNDSDAKTIAGWLAGGAK